MSVRLLQRQRRDGGLGYLVLGPAALASPFWGRELFRPSRLRRGLRAIDGLERAACVRVLGRGTSRAGVRAGPLVSTVY